MSLSQIARKKIFSYRKSVRDRGRHYLAKLYRQTLSRVSFIGITGSAGKTTTKSLTQWILSAYGDTAGSVGGANEHFDVEWAVLRTRRHHAFAVVEVAAPSPGYLDRSLAAIRPDIGVLTTIAREHYSAYRDLRMIAQEKGKLVAALPKRGVAVLNRDDPLVREIGERTSGCRVIWVGREKGSHVRLLEAHSNWPDSLHLTVKVDGQEYHIKTQLHGTQLVTPVLCSLGVAIATGVPMADAVARLALADPVAGRMKIQTTADGVTFIRDDFKAPQWSFDASINFLKTAAAPRKVAVIGTISDSPRSPAKRYQAATRTALEAADLVVLVGVEARTALTVNSDPGKAVHAFPTIKRAADFLSTELRAGDLVLLKGTNRQDHLVRLVLHRDRAVQCWRTNCQRNEFCGGCAMLNVPDPSSVSVLETADVV